MPFHPTRRRHSQAKNKSWAGSSGFWFTGQVAAATVTSLCSDLRNEIEDASSRRVRGLSLRDGLRSSEHQKDAVWVIQHLTRMRRPSVRPHSAEMTPLCWLSRTAEKKQVCLQSTPGALLSRLLPPPQPVAADGHHYLNLDPPEVFPSHFCQERANMGFSFYNRRRFTLQ